MHPWLTPPDSLVPLPSYFTLLIGGFMLAIYWAQRLAPRHGIHPDDMVDLGLYMLLAGLLGARILHVLADGYFMDYVHLCTDPLQVEVPSFMHVACATDTDCVSADAGALCHPTALTCRPARDCLAALKFWQGGLAFYGGFVLAVGVAVVFLRRRRIDFKVMADLCAPMIAFGLIFGRVGCLLAGCCFGNPTQAPVGLEFPGDARAVSATGACPQYYDLVTTEAGEKVCALGSPALVKHVERGWIHAPAQHSLPVHPTQVYEAAFCAFIFAYLFLWRRKRVHFNGQVFYEMCALYALGRFVVEFWRADDRGLWLGDTLSTSQLIALPIFVAAVVLLARGLRAPPEPPPAPLPPESP